MNIGKAIRYYRKKRGFTQRELAQKFNMSSCHLSVLENGNRTPNLSYLYFLAEILNVNIIHILLRSFDEDELEIAKKYFDKIQNND